MTLLSRPVQEIGESGEETLGLRAACEARLPQRTLVGEGEFEVEHGLGFSERAHLDEGARVPERPSVPVVDDPAERAPFSPKQHLEEVARPLQRFEDGLDFLQVEGGFTVFVAVLDHVFDHAFDFVELFP